MAKAKRPQASTAAGTIAIPDPANAADVPSVYANVIEVLSMNQVDVRIAFNEIVVESGNIPHNIRRANIVMSVPAFLGAVAVLQANGQQLIKNQKLMTEQGETLLQASLQKA